MKHTQHGQAALVTVLLILALIVVIVLGINTLAVRRHIVARHLIESIQTYYLSEAGLEDAIHRVTDPDLAHQATMTLTLNGHTATTQVQDAGSSVTITATGDVSNYIRHVSTVLQENTSDASFFYGIQVDDGGLSMGNNAVVNGNVFSNGHILGSNGARISGDAIVSGGLDDAAAVEWLTNNSDHFFGTSSSNRDMAQSFTANETGTLPQVTVLVGKVGSPNGNLTVRITADNAGQPATTSLANAIIPNASVSSSPTWMTAAFVTPAEITNGTKYWIVLDSSSNSSSNYWNWRKDSTGGYANNTGSYTDDWNGNNPAWTSVNGDLAFQAWIGGEAKRIQDMIVGSSTSGTGRANLFVSTTVHGSTCPNQYCLVENTDREELPITDQTIQDWQDDAAFGGTHTGDYTLTNNQSASLGPKIITGNLIVDNGSTLNITGTIWVQGDIQLSNNCIIELDDGYGTNSGVLMTSGSVQISNNCTFNGSGDPASYVLLLSSKTDPDNDVMTISNNSAGVVYYAPHGRLHFSNNATAKEATAWGITLDNGATITYETGLENINFTSGPSGGWDFTGWQEID